MSTDFTQEDDLEEVPVEFECEKDGVRYKGSELNEVGEGTGTLKFPDGSTFQGFIVNFVPYEGQLFSCTPGRAGTALVLEIRNSRPWEGSVYREGKCITYSCGKIQKKSRFERIIPAGVGVTIGAILLALASTEETPNKPSFEPSAPPFMPTPQLHGDTLPEDLSREQLIEEFGDFDRNCSVDERKRLQKAMKWVDGHADRIQETVLRSFAAVPSQLLNTIGYDILWPQAKIGRISEIYRETSAVSATCPSYRGNRSNVLGFAYSTTPPLYAIYADQIRGDFCNLVGIVAHERLHLGDSLKPHPLGVYSAEEERILDRQDDWIYLTEGWSQALCRGEERR